MTTASIATREVLTERERRRRYALLYADGIFNEDGTVRRPRMTSAVIGWCAKSGRTFSRQPTLQRALAVVDSVRPDLAERELRARIRIGRRSGTFGVYLVPARITTAPAAS